MTRRARSFDRLARWYRLTEILAFGGDLERTRFEYLGRLAECRSILLLGEGDGRCAARLATLAPHARILCVDSSPGMIAAASRRIEKCGASDRVTFTCADALTVKLPEGAFDAVATLFLLDCFTPESAAALVARVGAALKPRAVWLFADFVLPPRGFRRLRARTWLWFLYAFFRWVTDIPVAALPPSEEILAHAGWTQAARRDRQRGMLRSAVYERVRGIAPAP